MEKCDNCEYFSDNVEQNNHQKIHRLSAEILSLNKCPDDLTIPLVAEYFKENTDYIIKEFEVIKIL